MTSGPVRPPNPPARANFVRASQAGDPDEPFVLSYLGLRKAVGIIGLTLPIVLVFGTMFVSRSAEIERSISYYYYTCMGSWFVGSLWAIGVFLLSTRGYDHRDAIAGRLACFFAIGVSLFPTSPTSKQNLVGYIHWTCAALLFLILAYFCLCLFTETARDKTPTVKKGQRNTVYRVCGWIILVSIACIPISKIPTISSVASGCQPVFWFETFAVLAFGVAWLVKGEAILKD
jgi:hypothetical protein